MDKSCSKKIKMSKDYYNILEVEKTATQDEIKKSYRRLSKKYHPDKAGDDSESIEKFKEVAEAYEILSDEQKRKNYDSFGDPKGQDDSFGDIRNQFRDAFNGFGRGNGIVRGESIPFYLTLTLEEIQSGVKKKIKYKKNSMCKSCSGNGSKFGKSLSVCSACLGSGMNNRQLGHMVIQMPCGHCGGNGKFITEVCENCGASGISFTDMEIEVNLPPGVFEGWKIRANGYGHDAFADRGIPGDLYIIIKESPHDVFERQGDNLICKTLVSYPDIVLGTKVDIQTLTKKVSFEIPPNTPVGKMFKLNGCGLPSIANKGYVGDLIVVVGVDVPKQISEEDKKLLEELRKSSNFTSK